MLTQFGQLEISSTPSSSSTQTTDEQIQALRASLPDPRLLMNFSRRLEVKTPIRESSRSPIPLSPRFEEEALAEKAHRKYYMSAEQRQEYLITTTDGVFFNKRGNVLFGEYIYDLFPAPDNSLYCASSILTNLHHSYISEGMPLKGAGCTYYAYGYLITVSNESGHYAPPQVKMHNALIHFLNISQKNHLLFEDHSQMNPELPFDGIRYYKVSFNKILQFELLNEQQLIEYCQNALNEADALYQERAISLSANTDTVEESQTEDSEEDTNTIYYSSHTVLPVKEIPDNSIFNIPEVMALTFLKRFQSAKATGGLTSRFNGVKRRARSSTF